MSGVLRNINPPTPYLWCGGGHTRWVERGWGVNSSEDARHCYVLYICKCFVVPPQRINNLQKPTSLSAFIQFTDSIINTCYNSIAAEQSHLPSFLVKRFCVCGYSYDNSSIKDRSHAARKVISFLHKKQPIYKSTKLKQTLSCWRKNPCGNGALR